MLTLSADEDGVLAASAVADVVAGTASAARRWAPPPISPREDDPDGWPLHDPESGDEAAARQEALDLLPAGSRPMNVGALAERLRGELAEADVWVPAAGA